MSGDMSIRQAFVQGLRESTGDFQTKASPRSEVASGVTSKESQAQNLGKMSSLAQFSGALAGKILGQNLTSKILGNMDSKIEKKEAEAFKKGFEETKSNVTVMFSGILNSGPGGRGLTLYAQNMFSLLADLPADKQQEFSNLFKEFNGLKGDLRAIMQDNWDNGGAKVYASFTQEVAKALTQNNDTNAIQVMTQIRDISKATIEANRALLPKPPQ